MCSLFFFLFLNTHITDNSFSISITMEKQAKASILLVSTYYTQALYQVQPVLAQKNLLQWDITIQPEDRLFVLPPGGKHMQTITMGFNCRCCISWIKIRKVPSFHRNTNLDHCCGSPEHLPLQQRATWQTKQLSIYNTPFTEQNILLQ